MNMTTSINVTYIDVRLDESFVSPFSAGIGRTGIRMTVDMALEQAALENVVDIPAIAIKMRRQRMKMVQNSVREADTYY